MSNCSPDLLSLSVLRWQMAYDVGVGMGLVDGNEFGSEAEADDGDVDLFAAHVWMFP